ncbi:Iron-binding protein IscA [bacterium HR40]|nr:Iron-binding protein IscA [bacterium HR40]
MATTTESLVRLTERAASRMRALLQSQGEGAFGIRLGVRPRGCSGYSYALDFAREVRAADRVVEWEDVRLVVDGDAVPMLAGTEIDWVEDRLGAQFVFRNPNEKARCGCGESFAV